MKIKETVQHTLMWVDHRIVSKSFVIAHASYYSLVSVEAHGMYRYAAGVILVFTIIEHLSHVPEPPKKVVPW